MLEHIFSSRTRVKLLTIFLSNPNNEYFVRELTRLLGEQINSIRRELANLKKIGLLRSRAHNRKKYYNVNKNFVIFDELLSIVAKTSSTSSELVNDVRKLGKLDLLLITGNFINVVSPIDILIIGDFDKENIAKFVRALEKKMKHSLRYSIMTTEDYNLRQKCKDQFLTQVLSLKHSILYSNIQD